MPRHKNRTKTTLNNKSKSLPQQDIDIILQKTTNKTSPALDDAIKFKKIMQDLRKTRKPVISQALRIF